VKDDEKPFLNVSDYSSIKLQFRFPLLNWAWLADNEDNTNRLEHPVDEYDAALGLSNKDNYSWFFLKSKFDFESFDSLGCS
jgi:hypothetical protein